MSELKLLICQHFKETFVSVIFNKSPLPEGVNELLSSPKANGYQSWPQTGRIYLSSGKVGEES